MTADPRSACAPLLRDHRGLPRPPFDRTVLLLQGGGGLGAYQAGAFQALDEAGLGLDWIAGVSIGAVNAAIIAGNPPGLRLARLQEFWSSVSIDPVPVSLAAALCAGVADGEPVKAWLNHLSAAAALGLGVADFYHPRWPPPWLWPPGAAGATSLYDPGALRRTLERLVDFERINSGGVRVSMGAVNVRTGNFVFFDTTTHVLTVDHVMASAALPPLFPPVEIEGQAYWDGGLVSNTPLQWVLDAGPSADTLFFQVDLWNTRGEAPLDLADVITREREILFASRTRAATDTLRRLQRLRNAAHRLLDVLPEALRGSAEFAALAREDKPMAVRIVHLIYHARRHSSSAKDFEFSRLSMREHWTTGYDDAVRTLRHPEALSRPPLREEGEVGVFDVAVQGRL